MPKNFSLQRGFILALLVSCLFLIACGAQNNNNNRKATSSLRGRTFEAPEQALAALKDAFKSEDPRRLIEIFGEEGRDIIMSGDPTADRAAMRRVSNRLDQRAELIPAQSEEHPEESWYKLRFGIEGWNMRIPLISRGSGWYFETYYARDAAREARREINEVIAVDTILDIAKAQAAYFQSDRDNDGIKEYAQKIISSPGSHDGLFWPVQAGEPASPLAEPIAKALEEGYGFGSGKPQPYQGYVYRILSAQGRKARGGPRNYLVDGHLTGGFAILGYPVQWNVSGLRTYIVGTDGKVLAKDLGKNTTKIASTMSEIDPDNTWVRIDHRINRVQW